MIYSWMCFLKRHPQLHVNYLHPRGARVTVSCLFSQPAFSRALASPLSFSAGDRGARGLQRRRVATWTQQHPSGREPSSEHPRGDGGRDPLPHAHGCGVLRGCLRQVLEGCQPQGRRCATPKRKASCASACTAGGLSVRVGVKPHGVLRREPSERMPSLSIARQ